MKHKIKLHLLLIVTALIFTLENPAWHWLDAIKLHPTAGNGIAISLIWGETCLAIGALAIIIALITPPFSRFFLGYESKKPDEGDEVYFYVLITLFIFGLCLMGERLFEPPHRNMEKDLKYVCAILNDNLEFSSSDGTQQKVDSICVDEPAKPEADKE